MAMTPVLVSVVTPFYNTAEYLEECIQSVLAQSYSNFEYILLDNCSKDGSADIAEKYARMDNRIRFIKADTFVGQVPNYNRALRYISADSRFCKIVQADDWIYPDCLEKMVQVAMLSPKVGVVGSYSVYGDRLAHDGLPFRRDPVFDGREACRLYLSTHRGFLGSPTCVMFRSDLVRARETFFAEDHPCEDVAACLELLQEGDLGFVYQVLTFNRRDNEAFWTRIEPFKPILMHDVVLMHQFGPKVFPEAAYRKRLAEIEGNFYAWLGRACIEGRPREFWSYHFEGLQAVGLRADRARIAGAACKAALRIATNPRQTLKAWLGRTS